MRPSLSTMRMSWHDLLFAHWRVPVESVRRLVPPALDLDLFAGEAYVAVVPFRMTRVGPTWLPPLPGLHAFEELNVRTYVVHRGRPGVWFFSLDAANALAVRTARRFFHLPYFDAAMACRPDGDGIAYESVRTHRGAPPAALSVRYRPTSAPYASRPGDLDHWLTERYALYAADPAGRVGRVDIEHVPWPLQRADADFGPNTMGLSLGWPFLEPPTCLHFARRLDVVSGPLVFA